MKVKQEKWMKLIVGDIFSIKIKDIGFGLGQIIRIPNKESFSVVIFEKIYNTLDDLDLNKEVACKPLLFGNTFDAKFYHKHWRVIDNIKTDLNDIQLPYYKIGSFIYFVENFDEKKIKKASSTEKEILMYRKYVAPVRLEKALMAYHNHIEWNDDLYSALLYTYVLKSNEVVNSQSV